MNVSVARFIFFSFATISMIKAFDILYGKNTRHRDNFESAKWQQ